MSQAPGSIPATPKPTAPASSAAMRYLFLFLLGLVVGIVAVTMVLRAIEARKTTQDYFPRALMRVLDAHTGMLEQSAQANRCAASDVVPQLQALRTLANDIEPAFGDLREDARFARHASNLRAALDGALASPPLNCAGIGAALTKIGETCKACHQDFRN